jgi:hypothetical protein
MNLISDEKLWGLYIVLKRSESGQYKNVDLCKEHSVNYATFANFKTITNMISDDSRLSYFAKKLIDLRRSGLKTGTHEFVEKNCPDIIRARLNKGVQAVVFMRRIEELKMQGYTLKEECKKETKPTAELSFLDVTPKIMQPSEPIQECLPASNIIEISVPSGIKVVISPQIDIQKIVKIIEFLKEI